MTNSGFINPADCLDRLPVRMSLREFRKRVINLGLCYKHGHQIMLDEIQLDAGDWSGIQTVDAAYGHLEFNETDAAVLDMGSQLAEQMAVTPLTHTNFQQRRRRDGKSLAKDKGLI